MRSLLLPNFSTSIYLATISPPWYCHRNRLNASKHSILRQSPNLQECHLKQVYFQDNFTCSAIMPHTELQHLNVILSSTLLFDSITLPSLSHLSIHYNGPKNLTLSSISSLILRSSCKLERFTIEKYHFEAVRT